MTLLKVGGQLQGENILTLLLHIHVFAGSSRLSDEALRRACYTVRFLFADRPDVRQAYYEAYGRFAIMATTEVINNEIKIITFTCFTTISYMYLYQSIHIIIITFQVYSYHKNAFHIFKIDNHVSF